MMAIQHRLFLKEELCQMSGNGINTNPDKTSDPAFFLFSETPLPILPHPTHFFLLHHGVNSISCRLFKLCFSWGTVSVITITDLK